MKFAKILCVIATLCVSTISFSQIATKGVFVLGDTTQVHQLTTTDGDIFTGRVIGFDETNLTFQYRKQKLSFQTKDIQLITVIDNNPNSRPDTESPPAPERTGYSGTILTTKYFSYKITDLKGNVSFEKILKLKSDQVMVERENGQIKLLKTSEIQDIFLAGDRITSTQYQPGEHHRLATRRGDVFIGQLLSFQSDSLIFLMKNGSEITLPQEELFSLFWEEIPPSAVRQSTQEARSQQRLFFSPSAMMLEKDESEFRTLLLYNTLEHGVSDNLTVGGGLFSLLVANAISGKIKVGASLNKYIHMAAGAQGTLAFTIYDNYTVSLGLFYGALSVGTKDHYITASVGRGKSSEDSRGTTAFSLGGSLRISRSWRAYAEFLQFQDPYFNSFYDNDNYSMGTVGLSWFKEAHQIDFGIFTSDFDDVQTGFPVVAYSYRF